MAKVYKDTPKNIYSACIRIFLQNSQHEYTLDEIDELVRNLASRYSQTKWAYVLHDKDVSKKSPSELTDPHVHIVMRFCNGVNSMYLFKQFPGAYIETAQNVKGAIRYLIHLDDKDKAQYSVDCVKSNYDPECLSEILCEPSSKESMRKEPSKSDLDGVLDRIVQGEIRQYNLYDVLNPTTYIKHKTKIDNAFEVSNELFLSRHSDDYVHIYFIIGTSGVGKSTLAQMIAEKDGDGSYCDSSSSNDPMTDYKGENTLILNDLRDDVFSLPDLLKMLDPYRRTSTKSRYKNKLFKGKNIIVTSTVEIEKWYEDSSEDKLQLFRRIEEYILLDHRCMSIYEFEVQDGDVFKRLKCQKDNPTISYIQKKKINNKKSILDILNLPSISLTSNEFGNNNDERMDCNG